MKMYQISNAGIFTGVSADVDPLQGTPDGWVNTEPPELGAGEYALWSGRWSVTTAAPTRDWPALIATRRWLAETSGTTFGGMPIATDDRSKLLINGAVLRADRSADYVLRWKTSQGFVDLTAAQVLAVADVVSEHVQLCFDREDALLLAVADGSITAEMLEEGWPA